MNSVTIKVHDKSKQLRFGETLTTGSRYAVQVEGGAATCGVDAALILSTPGGLQVAVATLANGAGTLNLNCDAALKLEQTVPFGSVLALDAVLRCFDAGEEQNVGVGQCQVVAAHRGRENPDTGTVVYYKGAKGDPFTWDDLTEEQKDALADRAAGRAFRRRTVIVQDLPDAATADKTAFYLVPKASAQAGNVYDEYIVTEPTVDVFKWEKVGDTEIDLSGYVPASRKVAGKALTSDITIIPSDIGAAAAADAKLTPVYSQTPTFSAWTYEGLPEGTTISLDYGETEGSWIPDVESDYWAYFGDGVYSPDGANALSLTIGLWHYPDSTSVTATRTRTDVIGYLLGSQVDKLLASEAEVEALRQGKQDKLTFDEAPARLSNGPVKSKGIWSAIWGTLTALPTGFTSLYDWCVSQLAGKLSLAGGAMDGPISCIQVAADNNRKIHLARIGLAQQGVARKGAGNLGVTIGLQDGTNRECSLYIDDDGKVYINTPTGYVEVPNATAGGILALVSQIPPGASVDPLMDGSASVGSATAWARSDHVHPKDTSKQDVISDLETIRTGASAGATAIQKVSGATAGNLASLTAAGGVQDAGYHFEVRNGIPCIVQYT